jgi:hypothetical protein
MTFKCTNLRMIPLLACTVTLICCVVPLSLIRTRALTQLVLQSLSKGGAPFDDDGYIGGVFVAGVGELKFGCGFIGGGWGGEDRREKEKQKCAVAGVTVRHRLVGREK